MRPSDQQIKHEVFWVGEVLQELRRSLKISEVFRRNAVRTMLIRPSGAPSCRYCSLFIGVSAMSAAAERSTMRPKAASAHFFDQFAKPAI